MPNHSLSPVVLVAALIPCAVFASMGQGVGPITSMAALSLLLVLFAYDREGDRSLFQSLAFACVCAFCLLFVVLPWAPLLGFAKQTPYFPLLIWGAGIVVFLAIDRVRVSSRLPTGAPVPVRSSVQTLSFNAPLMHQSETAEPPVPEFEAPKTAPPAAPLPSPAPPPSKPGKPPKEATIYVAIVGEGLNVLKPVRSQDLGRGYYLITEEPPEGERWEFTAGQVVKCQKKNLSTGKGLVAVEEAQRA